MQKVWIEVALNGAWGRRLQPGIPDTVEHRRRGYCLRARRRLHQLEAAHRRWVDPTRVIVHIVRHHTALPSEALADALLVAVLKILDDHN